MTSCCGCTVCAFVGRWRLCSVHAAMCRAGCGCGYSCGVAVGCLCLCLWLVLGSLSLCRCADCVLCAVRVELLRGVDCGGRPAGVAVAICCIETCM
eukprot:scaffold12543_cov115-Isochrysis_galbana.AAC.3